jgi:hypothetical protein
MNNQIQTKKKGGLCPASTDWAYITVNTALWLLGAFGMFWMTNNIAINLIMPIAYLVATFLFFWRIFGKWVCATCAYHHPDLSKEEYMAQLKDRFLKTLKRGYKVWFLIGGVWPVVTMIIMYFVSRKPIVLASLLLFLVISFGVFLPVLRLRVCPRCIVNEYGICPIFQRHAREQK